MGYVIKDCILIETIEKDRYTTKNYYNLKRIDRIVMVKSEKNNKVGFDIYQNNKTVFTIKRACTKKNIKFIESDIAKILNCISK